MQPISLYPLILFLMLFLLQHPAASFPAGGYCKTTASFMYYFHPLGILFVQRFTERPTIVFAAVTEIFLLVGCVVYAVDIWIKKHFPKKKKVSN